MKLLHSTTFLYLPGGLWNFRTPLAEGCRPGLSWTGTALPMPGSAAHAFRLPTADGDVLLFPQITIVADGEIYRVDFLIRYKGIGTQWRLTTRAISSDRYSTPGARSVCA